MKENKKMMIGVIYAQSANGFIGMQNQLPWKFVGKELEDDMERFKDITTGNGNNAIVYGRMTLESFGNRALPKRVNVVLSRDASYVAPEKVTHYNSYPEAMQALQDQGIQEVWICGGRSVYEEALKRGPYQADRIVKTTSFDDYEGDVEAPKYDPVPWRAKIRSSFPKKGYQVETFERIV